MDRKYPHGGAENLVVSACSADYGYRILCLKKGIIIIKKIITRAT